MNKGAEIQTERPKICTRLPEMHQISALCGSSYADLKFGANIAKKAGLSQSCSLEASLAYIFGMY